MPRPKKITPPPPPPTEVICSETGCLDWAERVKYPHTHRMVK